VRGAWQEAEAPGKYESFDVCDRAKRKEIRLKVLHVLELACALVLLVGSVMVAQYLRLLEMWIWASVVWITTLAASGFSIWNWRSLWKAENKTAVEYAETYENYCIAGLRQIRFGYRLLAVQLAIVVPWFSWKFFFAVGAAHWNLARYLIGMGLAAVLTTVYLVWFSTAGRKRLRELELLREYRKSLAEKL